MSSITFVTSILNIYENDYDPNKTIHWRVDRFRELANLGIKICIYISPEMESLIRPIESEFPYNVKIMRILRCEDTIIAKMLETDFPNYRLPDHRNTGKDIAKYSIVINSKTEFMSDTVHRNPWETTHFAWIDFNITYVFLKKFYTYPFLKWLDSQNYINSKCFIIPGCVQQYDNENTYFITDNVHWRFCGGFFLGDGDSILHFHDLYMEHFPRFMRTYNTLVWEVNFWAWLERNSDWNPTWYLADHNDTIITEIMVKFFTKSLESLGAQKIVYDYPKFENQPETPMYLASSASYLETDGKLMLNTRYVNYWYHEEGYYMFGVEPPNTIRNRNFYSELDPNTMYPKFLTEMQETVDLPKYDNFSRGIEDIRLYQFQGKTKFIGTTVNYCKHNGNRMIIGDYIVDGSPHYENTKLVSSPENHHLEKNWVPMILNNPDSPFHNRELFIYKWSPFEIGELCKNLDEDEYGLKLNIIERHDTGQNPFFYKMKGSTPFIDTGKYLVGVVHFTEDAKLRRYYHMMVTLDRNTLRPLRYSDPFCFEEVSIEFCIGFTIRDGKYLFWISIMDRDPALFKIPVDKIPIHRDFL
jgi:Bacterial protein of unknown function (HtrL_YibB)